MRSRDLKRFEAKIERDGSGCWLWTGCILRTGYGQFRLGKMRPAHRVSYEYYKGNVPEGYQIDHLCRIRRCVNPEHLEIVTPRENTRRSPFQVTTLNSQKTHCPNGHPLTWGNLRLSVLARKRDAGRLCLTCHRIYQREWMRAYRAKKRELKPIRELFMGRHEKRGARIGA